MACPACKDKSGSATPSEKGDWVRIDCPKCGRYELTGSAQDSSNFLYSESELPFVPYNLRLMQSDGAVPRLSTADLAALKTGLQRPSPSEAADNLITYLGRRGVLGSFINISQLSELPYVVGVTNPKGLRYLSEEMEKIKLLNIDRTSNAAASPQNLLVDLSLSGWQRYEALQLGAHSGRFAFMAMQFGNDELNSVVDRCFRPSVSSTGFELRLLNDKEHQRAGLIDDRLRNELKQARFLIVDLTHENHGAYWEAGYGEGLGKPVIYTCKKKTFLIRSSKGGGTHFDTNHHLHILWDINDLSNCTLELAACIRATIPESKRS